MMNNVGKLMVLVQVFLSLLALTAAAALFLLAPDWGLKQPRLEVTERIPSELDKRIAATRQAIVARDMAATPVGRAQDNLLATMDSFATNHVSYRKTLEELRTGTGPLTAKEVKYEGGALQLQPPLIGPPVMDELKGIDKSLAGYRLDLTHEEKGLYKTIKDLTEEVREYVAKNNKVTQHLQGLNPASNKKDRLGLYDLLEHEAQMQHRIRAEKEYLQPQWAESLEQAQNLEERRANLQRSLDRLKGAK